MLDAKCIRRWNRAAAKLLKGRKIVSARYVGGVDHDAGMVLEIRLDSGVRVYPMSDDEGNSPGALHATYPGESLPTLR